MHLDHQNQYMPPFLPPSIVILSLIWSVLSFNAYLHYSKSLLIAISVKGDGIFFGDFDVASCSQNQLFRIFESNPNLLINNCQAR